MMNRLAKGEFEALDNVLLRGGYREVTPRVAAIVRESANVTAAQNQSCRTKSACSDGKFEAR